MSAFFPQTIVAKVEFCFRYGEQHLVVTGQLDHDDLDLQSVRIDEPGSVPDAELLAALKSAGRSTDDDLLIAATEAAATDIERRGGEDPPGVARGDWLRDCQKDEARHG